MDVKIRELVDLENFLRSIPPEGLEVDDEVIGFDMGFDFRSRRATRHECGSASCIGGWLQVLRPDLRKWPMTQAMDRAFSLSWTDITHICYPPQGSPGWNSTPQQAAELLRHYRETGVVDWDLAMEVRE